MIETILDDIKVFLRNQVPVGFFRESAPDEANDLLESAFFLAMIRLTEEGLCTESCMASDVKDIFCAVIKCDGFSKMLRL